MFEIINLKEVVMLKKSLAVAILSTIAISGQVFSKEVTETFGNDQQSVKITQKIRDSVDPITKRKIAGDVSFKLITLKLKENSIGNYDKIKNEIDSGKDVIEAINNYAEILNYKVIDLNNVSYNEALSYSLGNSYQKPVSGSGMIGEVNTKEIFNLYLTNSIDKDKSVVSIAYKSKGLDDSLNKDGFDYKTRELVQRYVVTNGRDKIVGMFSNDIVKKDSVIDIVVFKVD